MNTKTPPIKIHYKSGYKYQLASHYVHNLKIYPDEYVGTQFIHWMVDGRLIIWKGYAWDGPSGPTIDTKNFMRGSLVHDALYQLMRQEHMPESQREYSDGLLKEIFLEDGMSKFRAWYVWKSVRMFGGNTLGPKPVQTAP